MVDYHGGGVWEEGSTDLTDGYVHIVRGKGRELAYILTHIIEAMTPDHNKCDR